MSWLRDHFYSFVFPAFLASGKDVGEIGEPFDVRASPHAPKRLPAELQKLWTLCKEHGVPWSWDVRESSSGSSKYREMARVHHQVMRDTLNSALVAMRAEGCDRLFLGGRDVWVLAVMCERRRVPNLFVPELSRPVCDFPGVRGFLESRGFTGSELFLDTGFAGSIPRSLAKWYGNVPFKFRLMSQSDQPIPIVNAKGVEQLELIDGWVPPDGQPGKIGFKAVPFADPEGVVDVTKEEVELVDCDPSLGGPPRRVNKKIEKYRRRPNQLFPNWAKAREEALAVEYLAKYWTRGTHGSAALQGHAADVWRTWRDRPGLMRYSDPRNLQLGLTDGRGWIQVALIDLRILGDDGPKFHAWWKALRECAPGQRPPERVIQTFADRSSIQRAAMLTSMVWRGIPYWRVKGPPGEREKNVKNPYFQQAPGTGSIVTMGTAGAVTVTNTMSFNSANSTANYVYFQDPNLANPMLAPVNAPVIKKIAAALAAGEQVEVPASDVHQLDTPLKGLLPAGPSADPVPQLPLVAEAL